MAIDSSSRILAEALRLRGLGLSIIPVRRNKKPAIESWKTFQTKAADEDQVRKWFSSDGGTGIGIVLGRVSQHHFVRDFDNRNAYDRWAQLNPELANTLPTVSTGRGWHVYGRYPGVTTARFRDGELRGAGSYVVAPPSEHPYGVQYSWKIQLISIDDIPMINPSELGLAEDLALDSGDSTDRHRSDGIGSVRSVLSVESVLSERSVLSVAFELILSTLPAGPGQRRGRLFELARRIRVHPELAAVSVRELRPIVKEWYRLALPVIQTKSFDETWSDFVEAYGNVDPARCGDSAEDAMIRAGQEPFPEAAELYDSVVIRRLVGLCYELSRCRADGVFYISCRKAAELLETSDYKSVARWLQMLVADEVLAELQKGGPATNKATRYCWLPLPQSQPWSE